MKGTTDPGTCSKRCRTCVHHSNFGCCGEGETARNQGFCEYLEDTGKMRPCRPGDECTVYQEGKRRPFRKYKDNFSEEADEA